MRICYEKGDLVQMARKGQFGAVAHGCNCFHTMGSGIAPKLNKLSGGALLEADQQTSYADINKMGTFSHVDVEVDRASFEIYNLYTQFVYGGQVSMKKGAEPVYVSWMSVYEALCNMVSWTKAKHIGIPLIGCGLAGGKREHFDIIISDVAWKFHGSGKILTIVEYQ